MFATTTILNLTNDQRPEMVRPDSMTDVLPGTVTIKRKSPPRMTAEESELYIRAQAIFNRARSRRAVRPSSIV